jgi:chemotaxis receptor (MCP) glutamine deamidase CheD
VQGIGQIFELVETKLQIPRESLAEQIAADPQFVAQIGLGSCLRIRLTP